MTNLHKKFPYDIFKILAIVFAAFLLTLQIYHLLNFSIWRDDAFFGSVAKNLASGAGYKAVFYDQSYSFHYGISIGPMMILLAALLMFIFGNSYWILSVVGIATIWILLALIYFSVGDKVIAKDRKWQFSFLFLLLSFLLSVFECNRDNFENGDDIGLWRLLMGDVSAALFVILSVILLFCANFNKKKVALAGLVLGFGILDKMIAAIAAVVIFIIFSQKVFWQKDKNNYQKILLVIIFSVAVAAPLVLFELVKLIAMGWQDYLKLATNHLYHIKTNAANRKIRCGFSDAAWMLLVPLTLWASYDAYKKRQQNKLAAYIGLVLILCFLFQLLWWAFFYSGCSRRYLVGAAIYCACGLSLLISSVERGNRFKMSFGITILQIIVVCHGVISNLFFGGFRNNGILQEQLFVAEVVKDLKQKDVVTISCGNNFELEYLLPKSQNFINCKELLKNSLKSKKVILVTYFMNSVVKYEVAVEGDEFFGRVGPVPDFAELRCDKVYLATDNYLLRWCKV